MLSAAFFARKAFEIEATHKADEPLSPETHHAHRGYVTAALFSAVASLEATINELFIAADSGSSPRFEGTDPTFPRLLAEYWREIEGVSTLTKYQTALILGRKPMFDKGANPYQSVNNLIQLRNALVRYKPERDTDQKEHKKIEHRLEGQLTTNPFSSDDAAFFPKKALEHGCAEWATQSSVAFIDDFFARIEVASTLGTESRGLVHTK